MALSIRTNIASLDAENNLTNTENSLNQTMGQLSSGYSITSPQDNSAGLAISNSLESDISSYTQASSNANDGLSVVQSTESALTRTPTSSPPCASSRCSRRRTASTIRSAATSTTRLSSSSRNSAGSPR